MQKRLTIFFIIIIITVSILNACRKAEPLSEEEHNEIFAGGRQTVFINGSGAFSQPFPVLAQSKMELHRTGDAGFEAIFNSDPNQINYGLGPIYNNVSCASCHVADGRGKAPITGEALSSLLLRISVPGTDVHGGPNGVPGFGGQLQQRGILGAAPEADVQVTYQEQSFTFPDGEPYSLRQPVFNIVNSYLPLPAGLMVSPRMPPPVFGLGLLENIAEADILMHVDEFDSNHDSVSGRPNYVWDVLKQGYSVGRFGWKSGQPNVLQQSAGAYNQDMGITSFIFPQESSAGQPQGSLSKNKKEISDSLLYAVAYYVRTLAVPARRNADDADVKHGKMLFAQIGCKNCHVATYQTAADMVFPELSNQRIFPYTDLLLHDMGTGLADYRSEFMANGYEWRTAPLWGIGLTKLVNGHMNFLHDGRARNLKEAILWHGGEANKAKNQFVQLSKVEREALIKFLESL